MGIWLIYYGLAEADAEEYLDWFEQVHIAEKLARPGYDWAAHYRVTSGVDPRYTEQAYIAMFGAASSRVFYDPSPMQLKPAQDGLTRQMVGHRQSPLSVVFSEEWADSGQDAGELRHAITAPVVVLSLYGDSATDQDLAAWCAQEKCPASAAQSGSLSVRKWLGSSGPPRHALLEEFRDLEAAGGPKPVSDWASRQSMHLLTAPVMAERCWPC